MWHTGLFMLSCPGTATAQLLRETHSPIQSLYAEHFGALAKVRISGSNSGNFFLMYVYTQFPSVLLFDTVPNYWSTHTFHFLPFPLFASIMPNSIYPC